MTRLVALATFCCIRGALSQHMHVDIAIDADGTVARLEAAVGCTRSEAEAAALAFAEARGLQSGGGCENVVCVAQLLAEQLLAAAEGPQLPPCRNYPCSALARLTPIL